MDPKVKVGFVGAGGVARRHADVLLGLGEVEVAGIADLNGELASDLAGHCGARAYRTHDELLSGEELDALYVCVPPFAHGPPEHAAIDAGLPLFVEKPVAIDLSTASAIAERVEAADLVTAVGYHWRYLDTVEQAAALLEGNPARLVTGSWLDKVPPPAWWVRRDRSGGQTIEQSTHVLDLIRHLTGEVSEVYAVEATAEHPRIPEADVADVSSATLRFADGAIGSLSSSCLLRSKHRAGLEIIAEGVAISLSEADIVVDTGDGPERREAEADAKTAVDRDFIDAVLGRENRIRVPYAEALETHHLACAIVRSASEGRPVKLTEDLVSG
ncbi:MAG: Gfo/Idh/MocA family oxidoreductase [Thermoleophilaceae bacterium]